jgi:hypothetical protein
MQLPAVAQLNKEASLALIKRVVPQQAAAFTVESLPQKDVFEIESKQGKIILRGNNGVAVASALYYYLTEYAHCQITWNGTNLKLPVKLPVVPQKIKQATPYEYRYYLNYCTFNYSMSWWDWARWQQFFTLLNKSLVTGTTPDLTAFGKTISQWEWKWVNQQKAFPVKASGNPATVSKEMYNKYHKLIESAY